MAWQEGRVSRFRILRHVDPPSQEETDRRLIVPALGRVLPHLFRFHAFHGDYGIYAKYRLEDRIVHLKRDLASVEKRRVELERKRAAAA
jgi:cell division protein FtsB